MAERDERTVSLATLRLLQDTGGNVDVREVEQLLDKQDRLRRERHQMSRSVSPLELLRVRGAAPRWLGAFVVTLTFAAVAAHSFANPVWQHLQARKLQEDVTCSAPCIHDTLCLLVDRGGEAQDEPV